MAQVWHVFGLQMVLWGYCPPPCSGSLGGREQLGVSCYVKVGG
jgi:hypothetical protein